MACCLNLPNIEIFCINKMLCNRWSDRSIDACSSADLTARVEGKGRRRGMWKPSLVESMEYFVDVQQVCNEHVLNISPMFVL